MAFRDSMRAFHGSLGASPLGAVTRSGPVYGRHGHGWRLKEQAGTCTEGCRRAGVHDPDRCPLPDCQWTSVKDDWPKGGRAFDA